ncbi:hypothetical protein BURPS1655_B0025 [Burkholderia pseudomallei 1655]|nr:hypothetical protein BURPS1655_B0025 [Burkholderia pseudomallei 1655]
MRIRLLDDNLSARLNELAGVRGAGRLRMARRDGARAAMRAPVRLDFGEYYTGYLYSFP